MTQPPKETNSAESVYALADYKQMVLTYQAKHAELLKLVGLWKASVIWLGIATMVIGIAALAAVSSLRRAQAQGSQDIERLTAQVRTVSGQLEQARQGLATAERELAGREAVIKDLQENISTTSKKLLEKLLSEEKASVPTGQ